MLTLKHVAGLAGMIVALNLSACAATTSKAHAERNKNISLANLLGGAELTDERRAELVQQNLDLAQSSLDERQYKNARTAAMRVKKLDPENISADFILAEINLNLNNPIAALEQFERLNSNETSSTALQGMGLASLNLGDIQTGRATLQQALDLDPNLWRAHNGIGVSYALEKNWADAEKSYNRAILIKPDSADVQNNLGLTFIERGRYAEALQTFSKAMAQSQDHAIPDTNYRWAQALNGKMDMALSGLDNTGKAVLYNKLGQSSLNEKNYSKAISYFKSALQLHPSHFEEADQNLQTAIQAAE